MLNFVTSCLREIRKYVDCVSVERWKVWYTGKYTYVRVEVKVSDGDILIFKSITLRFSKSGVAIVGDYDPRIVESQVEN